MKIFKIIFTKAFWINVLLAIGIFFLLIWITSIALKMYTRHGEDRTVPSLVGQNFDDAKRMLKEEKMRWVVMDSTFSQDHPPLAVLEQTPKAGQKVKEGRTIYITINATKPPKRLVPNLIERSSRNFAKDQLVSRGFVIGDEIYKPSPDKDAVLDMLIDGKSLKGMKDEERYFPVGTKIDMVYGNGLGSTQIQVPRLIGLTYEEAKFVLAANDLNEGYVFYDEFVTDSATAVVAIQDPPFIAGEKIRIGEPVNLRLWQELPEGYEPDSMGTLPVMSGDTVRNLD